MFFRPRRAAVPLLITLVFALVGVGLAIGTQFRTVANFRGNGAPSAFVQAPAAQALAQSFQSPQEVTAFVTAMNRVQEIGSRDAAYSTVQADAGAHTLVVYRVSDDVAGAKQLYSAVVSVPGLSPDTKVIFDRALLTHAQLSKLDAAFKADQPALIAQGVVLAAGKQEMPGGRYVVGYMGDTPPPPAVLAKYEAIAPGLVVVERMSAVAPDATQLGMATPQAIDAPAPTAAPAAPGPAAPAPAAPAPVAPAQVVAAPVAPAPQQPVAQQPVVQQQMVAQPAPQPVVPQAVAQPVVAQQMVQQAVPQQMVQQPVVAQQIGANPYATVAPVAPMTAVALPPQQQAAVQQAAAQQVAQLQPQPGSVPVFGTVPVSAYAQPVLTVPAS